MTNSKIFSERIKRLQKTLKNEGLSLFFVKDSVDLFYLTGMQMSLGYLYVFEKKARLFVDGRYFEMAKKKSPIPVEELSDENMAHFRFCTIWKKSKW